ncbi:TIGR02466 family protein [Hyphomicrobium sp.]|uniref:TIGR02466 family protein n=1 Tax=Hyphomicrobium sp. TaxID=82 RepID=UPI002D77FFF4|nr:TIGR02466 family protein [Hyphomicrobium sp.]HET6388210.1 TIGR02466 family protein [Hyphomicrobium sp.]
MARVQELFVTQIYREELQGGPASALIEELDDAAREICNQDRAGHAWAKANDYPGYTSYASLNDLPDRHPAFGDLVGVLDRHVKAFARVLEYELDSKLLALDSLWINVLRAGGHHTAHIHPHSVISGTLYLAVPKGASAIRYEDPRLPMFMAAPPRKPTAKEKNKTFVAVAPQAGTLLLWESWLRHEVPVNHALTERVSVSFNYRLDSSAGRVGRGPYSPTTWTTICRVCGRLRCSKR